MHAMHLSMQEVDAFAPLTRPSPAAPPTLSLEGRGDAKRASSVRRWDARDAASIERGVASRVAADGRHFGVEFVQLVGDGVGRMREARQQAVERGHGEQRQQR